MSLYFGNAFSLNMIDESCSISIIKMNDQEKIDSIINEAESVIGHVDLARILKVPYNRSSKEFLYQKIENINTKNFKYFERSCNRTN